MLSRVICLSLLCYVRVASQCFFPPWCHFNAQPLVASRCGLFVSRAANPLNRHTRTQPPPFAFFPKKFSSSTHSSLRSCVLPAHLRTWLFRCFPLGASRLLNLPSSCSPLVYTPQKQLLHTASSHTHMGTRPINIYILYLFCLRTAKPLHKQKERSTNEKPAPSHSIASSWCVCLMCLWG